MPNEVCYRALLSISVVEVTHTHDGRSRSRSAHGAARSPYAYFTPSQRSANRSASGGVLGAMARPASANPGLFPVSPHLNQLSPLTNTPNVR